MTSKEEVVLVDEDNNPVGTALKSEVHTSRTPLHQGFSVFLFNTKGEVLLQQRSHMKKTWPLVWSGSCCGHPKKDEGVEEAIRRRVAFELGITTILDLTPILPTFRYQCVRDNIMENEICPVWVGVVTETIITNPDEVEAIKWIGWEVLSGEILNMPGSYSEWCELEVQEMNTSNTFLEFYMKTISDHSKI